MADLGSEEALGIESMFVGCFGLYKLRFGQSNVPSIEMADPVETLQRYERSM